MNVLYVLLLSAALVVVELLIGGTRLLFALPADLVLATAAVLSLVSLRRPKAPPSRFCLGASAIFFGYVLYRGLTSPVAYIAWPDEFTVLGALVVYLMTACYVTDPQRRLWLLLALLGLGLGNVLVGARQFATGDNFTLFGFQRSERYTGRASGFYVCPDHLAFFLEAVGCLALAWAIWSRGRPWVKLAVGYAACGLFGGELLTGSRGGFLSAAAGLSVMTLLGLGRLRHVTPHRFRRALIVVAVAAGLAAFGVRAVVSHSTLLHSRAKNLVDMQDIRPRLWKAGYEQFLMEPVFGTGASTFLYYGRRLRDPHVQDDPIRTHNDYLELLGEYGLAGAAGLLLFLGAHLGTGGLTYRHFTRRAAAAQSLAGGSMGSNAAAWNIGALSAVAAIAAHSVVDFNLHIPANAMMAAFIFGILANPGRPAAAGADPVARPRWIDLAARLTLAAIGVILFVTGVPRLPGEYYCEKARVALRDRRLLAASGYALKGLGVEKRNPQLYFYLGEARLTLAGDGPDTALAHSFRQGADEAYRQGLELAPFDSALLLRHAEILTIFGDYAAAGRVFDKVLVWDPNSALVQTYLGFYLQRTGQLADAKQAYARALELAPNEAAAIGFNQVSKLGAGSN